MNINYCGVALLYVTLLLFCCGCSNHYDYKIQNYTLTFEPCKGSTDLKTTIEITYIFNGSEQHTGGFKFVGVSQVDSLACSDEIGILQSNIEYLKETRISWSFKPVFSGIKKIKASFILKGFIQKEDNLYSVNATWAGIFRVPVDNAKYCVLFTSKPKSISFDKPTKWESKILNNSICYFYSQSQMSKKSIRFNYKF